MLLMVGAYAAARPHSSRHGRRRLAAPRCAPPPAADSPAPGAPRPRHRVLVLARPSAAAPAIDLHWPWLGPLVAPLAGLLVGSLYVLAAGRQPSVDRAFIVLLGLVFLGSGAAGRLGLPEIVVGIAAGLAIAAAGVSLSNQTMHRAHDPGIETDSREGYHLGRKTLRHKYA